MIFKFTVPLMPVHSFLVQIFLIDADAINGVLNVEIDKPDIHVSIRS